MIDRHYMENIKNLFHCPVLFYYICYFHEAHSCVDCVYYTLHVVYLKTQHSIYIKVNWLFKMWHLPYMKVNH